MVGDPRKPDGNSRMFPAPRIIAVGEAALTIEFGDAVDARINDAVLALDAVLSDAPPEGMIEAVPTYRALMVHFDPLVTAFEGLRALLQPLADQAVAMGGQGAVGRSWRLPVAYGGPHGVDLEMLSARHGVTPERLIELHSGAAYRVYMLGFAPGFAYLGGLPECLATPRREDPRLATPAGTVSIGGAQSAVTSMAVPSGWHLIGQTPVRSFDPKGEAPFLFEPGDHVRFQPISADAFDTIAQRVARGEFQLLPDVTP